MRWLRNIPENITWIYFNHFNLSSFNFICWSSKSIWIEPLQVKPVMVFAVLAKWTRNSFQHLFSRHLREFDDSQLFLILGIKHVSLLKWVSWNMYIASSIPHFFPWTELNLISLIVCGPSCGWRLTLGEQLYFEDPAGLLRLHSSFRHDFKPLGSGWGPGKTGKLGRSIFTLTCRWGRPGVRVCVVLADPRIYSSQEGRCLITAAAFTKGFLVLHSATHTNTVMTWR